MDNREWTIAVSPAAMILILGAVRKCVILSGVKRSRRILAVTGCEDPSTSGLRPSLRMTWVGVRCFFGERIATTVCALVRNDREGRYGQQERYRVIPKAYRRFPGYVTRKTPEALGERIATSLRSLEMTGLGDGGFFGDAYCKFLQNVVKYISLKNMRFFGRQFMRFSFPP